LKAGGSPERSSSVQRFFKEEVQSHGWRTADLRRAAVRWRREILQKSDLKFLLQVADHLFAGTINEDKNVAVFLLENITDKFGDEEFRLLESWLPRISNWSDHDALVHYLIAPMVVAKPARGEPGILLGKVAEPLVSPGSLRGLDPGGSPKNIFFRDYPFVLDAPVR